MAVLFAASRIHNNPAAIHNSLEKGKANRVKEHRIAPIKKKGFLLPHLGDQVLSDIAPINGWINKPVTGPARNKMGNSLSFAPKKL